MHPLPPNAPMINGNPAVPAQINGEEDASPRARSGGADDEDDDSARPSLEAVCEDYNRRVTAFLARDAGSDKVVRRTQEQTRISIGVIERALGEYELSSLSLSYNGGKDCLVLLIIYLSTLHAFLKSESNSRSPLEPPFPQSLPAIYAQPRDPFQSMTRFVHSSARKCHLDLRTILTNSRPGFKCTNLAHKGQHEDAGWLSSNASGLDKGPSSQPVTFPDEDEERVTLRDAFQIYLDQATPSKPHPIPSESTHSKIAAIFVGTRRTDPHGSQLTHFSRTDHGWPDFMRIHPVLNWGLGDIWCFLRAEELRSPAGIPLAYCEMYDQGYTSLGGVRDTVRNPKLMYTGDGGKELYKPAYEMTDDTDERLGRE